MSGCCGVRFSNVFKIFAAKVGSMFSCASSSKMATYPEVERFLVSFLVSDKP